MHIFSAGVMRNSYLHYMIYLWIYLLFSTTWTQQYFSCLTLCCMLLLMAVLTIITRYVPDANLLTSLALSHIFFSLKVYDEILAVLKHVEDRNQEYNVTNNSIGSYKVVCCIGLTYSTFLSDEIKQVFFSLDFSHISAQTIFSLLDCLTRWVRLKADSTSRTQAHVNSRSERNDTTGIYCELFTVLSFRKFWSTNSYGKSRSNSW